ncbi:MAG TPA: GlxA family transcriptional regulator [Casimicrobiaceae bacterium]|nr:GlxA family transcriptional regulator [Casimicrobiaceae bacterium]
MIAFTKATLSRADAYDDATRRVASSCYVVGFFLIPDFPMLAFASSIEPLRAANRLSGQRLFDWRLVSSDGGPVRASNGIDVAVHQASGEQAGVDLLLVYAGTDVKSDAATAKWLRALSREGVALGGVSLGAYVLAQAGLLDGRRCTLHWENLAAFAERFPRARVTADVFVVDGNRYTCSGGTSGLDMMLHLISDRCGRALANDVSEQFIHPRIRETHDPQRMAVQSRVGVANSKLIAAIGMMEAQHEDPRPVGAIAEEAGLSPRQLERLFAKYVGTSPSHYYLRLRLERARTMLLQTAKPVLDVAVACGFASASHFSRCYRAEYGRKPSHERIAMLTPASKPMRNSNGNRGKRR